MYTDGETAKVTETLITMFTSNIPHIVNWLSIACVANPWGRFLNKVSPVSIIPMSHLALAIIVLQQHD
ncbi:hypothetical protein E2C01_092970 [Portunus trituberculatus]|uniref:Uncharacterized protein n=1 Tax=Portunus trituberculatus TaxID=210409 RepID=A0A5B7JTN3_PORTR|nr:hypothetical protein [Portunus trituberculatus]